MNQILFVEERKKKNLEDIKKIVLFFAITIIVFGLILSGQGTYGVYNRSKYGTEEDRTTKIELSQTETGDVLITVKSKTGISDLIYNWNSDASQTVAGNGKTTLEEKVVAPVGENTLTVKTIDVNGKQTTKQDTFTLNIDKPEIELSLVGNNIKIKVNSKVDLSYVTYQWNSDEEQKMDMTTYENKTMYEKEIEIPKGTNTLLVTAVDVYENKSEKTQEIKGVTKPKSSPIIQGEYIFFVVTADEDIKQVDFVFNGKNYTIKKEVIEASGDKKRVTYRMELEEGMNYLTIKTTTESGVVGEDVWKYEYKK